MRPPRDLDGVETAIWWVASIVGVALVVCLVLLALMMWHSHEARADEPRAVLTEQMETYLYGVAYGQCPQLRDMKNGCPPEWYYLRPSVVLLPPASLCAFLRVPAGCPHKGAYKAGVVYLRDDLDFASPIDLAVVVHEDVHHIQDLKDGPFKDCQDWLEREYEAYRIHVHVLIQDRQGFAAERVAGEARRLRCAQ